MCSGCDGYCAFCLTCDACNCKCFCMGRMLVSSCRCCMFVSCVNPVQALRAAFCMTCSLLMLVGVAIGNHMDEAYSRVGLVTALLVATSVSFCLPHVVLVSAFIILLGKNDCP